MTATATEPDVRDLLQQIREAIHGPQMLRRCRARCARRCVNS